MKEALAIIIVILMGAFAATKANGYTHPAHEPLLAPVYAHIDTNEQDRSEEITQLSQYITTQDDEFVTSGLKKIMNYLIVQQEKKDTTIYSAFLE